MKALRQQGKVLFLATNAHPEYVDLVLSVTFGVNTGWKNYFNLILYNCRKPLFERSENPFYALDWSNQILKGQKIDSVDRFLQSIRQGRIEFLEGNAILLTKYFMEIKPEIRIAFFGAHIFEDVAIINEFNKSLVERDFEATWEPIYVVEELSLAEKVHDGAKFD